MKTETTTVTTVPVVKDYHLSAGTEYIILNGKATPLRVLKGIRNNNNFFTPDGSTDRYFVHVRRATANEIQRQLESERDERRATRGPLPKLTRADIMSDYD